MTLLKVLAGVAIATSLGGLATPAGATTVAIPDTNPGSANLLGAGNASVAYSGLTFSASSSLGDGSLYNIGSNYYGGNPTAVLSDQQATSGLENILITLPTATTSFSVDYGTFNGSDVTFLLSNGASFTQSSMAGCFYALPDVFTVNSSAFTSVLVTSSDYVLNVNKISYAGGVPEPAAWALMLVGFCALGATTRFQRRKQAQAL